MLKLDIEVSGKETAAAKGYKQDLEEFTEAAEQILEDETKNVPDLVCSRCHEMVYHHKGADLPAYPTLNTLTKLLLNSPHQKNHIYHLIDAVDLPMSLIPDLRSHISSTLPKEIRRGITISYIVTRADLLMRLRKEVSSLMTWIKKVIKDALPEGEKVEGRDDKIHVISVRNGWGVGTVKEEIHNRVGGVWILGAVNVGKSRFVREVWPEGAESRPVTLEEAREYDILPEQAEVETDGHENKPKNADQNGRELVVYHKEQNTLKTPPTVSDIPGTTAAPIKVTYKTAGRRGKAWGELIDLPGMERWVGFGDKGLLQYVRDDKKLDLTMDHIIKHSQYTIKPG